MSGMRSALAVLLCLMVCAGAVTAADRLAGGFSDPPPEARPWVYWFWLNGNITREGLTADLEAMQRAGIGGVLIMEVDQGAPEGPVAFAGPQWRELFSHAVREAARLGLQINMNDDAGWNGSGGPWITPDKAMQKVVSAELTVSGPRSLDLPLPRPVTAGYYRDIAVLAFPTPAPYRLPDLEGKAAFVRQDFPLTADYPVLPAEQVISRERIVDLTGRLTPEGRLTWEVPEGSWTVLRLGCTLTGAVNAPAPASGRGLECDKLSPEGSEAAFAGLIGKLAADAGRLAGRTLVSTHVDSWENGAQNWTGRFPEEFRRRRGYDLRPYLPALTGRAVDSLEVTDRFLDDFRLTISELMLDNYAGHLRDLARRRGLRLSIEAYGDTVCDNLAYAGRADEPMGEFWSWPKGGAGGTLIEMASAAHVYGKRIVGAEAFTANDTEKWLGHPGNIKAQGDWAFCLGINRFVFHRYALQPWLNVRPGMSMGPWGLHYERTQTWWEQSLPWHRYLARCQFLLREGLPVVDVLCLAPEGAPRSYAPPPALERIGYKADVCSAEALLQRVGVKDGRLVLPDGMSYRLLALPGAEVMSPELLAHLERLAAGGATIVGTPPRKAFGLRGYPQADGTLQARAAKLWEGGRIRAGRQPQEVLAAAGVAPDFTADRVLQFIHRRSGDTDLYFVANTLGHAVNATCSFRVTGKPPQLWRPESGTVEPAAVYSEQGGVTRLPLRLEAAESVFVVFRPATVPSDPIVSVRRGEDQVWPSRAERPQILIRRALWAPAVIGRDVTRQVQRRLDAGERSFVVAELIDEGDPAPNVLKTLRVEYQVGEQVLSATATDPEAISFHAPGGSAITVRRAFWGPAGADTDVGKRTKDVTAQVQRLVDAGTTAFVVAELAAEGDPAPRIVKTLRLEYEVGGKVLKAEATDPEEIAFELPGDAAPAVSLAVDAQGRLRACAQSPGSYRLRTRSGRVIRFEAPAPRRLPLDVGWELQLPPAQGVPPLRLQRLGSWSEHSDSRVRHFSGTATYRTVLHVPPEALHPSDRALLDLGQVEVMAAVSLNGRKLGLLWKPPYVADVTGCLHAGDNDLLVEVTNLWPNRMIGDEQLPDDSDRNSNGTLRCWPPWLLQGKSSPTGRQTFTSWRLWHAGDALLPSGLLGPVELRMAPVLRVGR